LEYAEGSSIPEREHSVSELSARIADCLYGELGLRLNTKTKLFWLSEEKDKGELLKSLKKVSSGYEYDTTDDDDNDGEDCNEPNALDTKSVKVTEQEQQQHGVAAARRLQTQRV
jgi:hypothetical protein